jgi:hypothetical protein
MTPKPDSFKALDVETSLKGLLTQVEKITKPSCFFKVLDVETSLKGLLTQVEKVAKPSCFFFSVQCLAPLSFLIDPCKVLGQ